MKLRSILVVFTTMISLLFIMLAVGCSDDNKKPKADNLIIGINYSALPSDYTTQTLFEDGLKIILIKNGATTVARIIENSNNTIREVWLALGSIIPLSVTVSPSDTPGTALWDWVNPAKDIIRVSEVGFLSAVDSSSAPATVNVKVRGSDAVGSIKVKVYDSLDITQIIVSLNTDILSNDYIVTDREFGNGYTRLTISSIAGSNNIAYIYLDQNDNIYQIDMLPGITIPLISTTIPKDTPGTFWLDNSANPNNSVATISQDGLLTSEDSISGYRVTMQFASVAYNLSVSNEFEVNVRTSLVRRGGRN